MALILWRFRVARGLFGVSVGLAEVLMRAGLFLLFLFFWRSFRLGKGLICRIQLGGLRLTLGRDLC